MDRVKGFIAVIISGIAFGCMPLGAKIIFENGGNSVSLVFYRFLFSLPVLYIINKKQKIEMKITKEEFKKLSILSLFGYASTAVLLFMSYNYISSGLATTIHFVYPIFVTIGCVIFFKEKFNLKKFLCAVLCTFGIALFLQDLDANNSIVGIILSFASGITYAFYMIFLDKTSLRNMPPFKITFYLCLFSSGLVFIFSLITQTFTTEVTFLGWILTMILSIFITFGAVTLLQIGISIVGSQNASILSTFEPITSVIIGIIVFNEPVNFRVILGVVIIISAVVLLTIESRTIAHETKAVQEDVTNEL